MKLKALTLAAASALSPAKEVIAENIISSPNAKALYGHTFPLIAERYPDLNVMLVTRDFVPGAEEAHKNHDLSFYNFCNWDIMTDEMSNASTAHAEMESSMAKIFFNYATGDHIFIPENELIKGIKQDHTILSAMTATAVGGAYADTAQAMTLNHYFPDMKGTVGIITMPNQAMDPLTESTGLSGLTSQYLSITASGQDHMLHTIGHEIAHLLNRDGADEVLNDTTYCSSVNVKSTDHAVIGEAYADIEGARFLRAAENTGLTSGADIIGEVGHLRSVGTLMLTGNSYIVNSSEDMVSHLTNTAYDPTEADFKEAFDYSSLKGISTLPLFINNFADTLAGYAFSLDQKEQLSPVSDIITNEDTEYYESLPSNPAEVPENAYQFTWVGADQRQYQENPFYHYAAIKYLDENGHFEDIKSALRPEYAAALDDMVVDYMTGIQEIAPSIYNQFEPTPNNADAFSKTTTSNFQFDYVKFQQQMEDVDIFGIGNDVLATSEAYKTDPESYSAYKGLHQTTQAILNHMLK